MMVANLKPRCDACRQRATYGIDGTYLGNPMTFYACQDHVRVFQ